MKRFRIVLKANIKEPLMDGFNIHNLELKEAIIEAKERFYWRLRNDKNIELSYDDIEVIRVTNENGTVVYMERSSK